jgi:hypothetical protein
MPENSRGIEVERREREKILKKIFKDDDSSFP